VIRYAVISGLKLPDKHLGSYQYGSQGGWMCCNIHYLSAEQTPRQGGWMCCNVNHLNAKQTPSIISCSDVLIVFYFRTHFFDCLYDRARARRRLVPYVPATRGAVRSDEERSPLLIRDSDSSAAQGRSGFGGCWLP